MRVVCKIVRIQMGKTLTVRRRVRGIMMRCCHLLHERLLLLAYCYILGELHELISLMYLMHLMIERLLLQEYVCRRVT